MTQESGDPRLPIMEDLQIALADLERAREGLRRDELSDLEGIWPRLERIAGRINDIDSDRGGSIRPMMLALLDELERTIVVFGDESRGLQDKLRSASRSMAAGVAYRRTQDP